MTLNYSSLKVNFAVTVLVMMLVLLLPAIDRITCRIFHINTLHSLSGDSRESHLLRLRKLILCIIFLCYITANVYLVFFSRSAYEDYMIHVDPLNDFMNSFTIDSGILGMLKDIYTQGLREGFSHIHIQKFEDMAQLYLNIMLYIPMGYLLPYVFEWVRAKVKIRPVFCCFLLSFLTENLQLVFKRGFYDIDDILANTFGGLIGQILYISFAYVADHPDWRHDLRSYRKWKRHAKGRALYPFAKKIGMARTTITVSNPDTVIDFYIKQLGFRPIKQLIYKDSPEIDYLLQIGSFQLELVCYNDGKEVADQYLTFSVDSISKARKRLLRNGFEPDEIELDPYTSLRMLSIDGPDHVHIAFIEA